jgi:hypothetical protein
VLATALLIALLAAFPARGTAQDREDISSIYTLLEGSSYQFGCLGDGQPPCDGPIDEASSFSGSFELRRIATRIPAVESYAIGDVNWMAQIGEAPVRITGSGFYRVVHLGKRAIQRMVLRLAVGDAGTTIFDSGLVAGGTGGELPPIEVEIQMKETSSYGVQMRLVAGAVDPSAVQLYGLGKDGSFSEGCVEPCRCAIEFEGLEGSFGLVPTIETKEFTELAVVDVDWVVRGIDGPDDTAGRPVTGLGIYRLYAGGDLHQMVLDLDLDGEPLRVDSGATTGADFPRIGIALAENGFYCYDRIFSFTAAP